MTRWILAMLSLALAAAALLLTALSGETSTALKGFFVIVLIPSVIIGLIEFFTSRRVTGRKGAQARRQEEELTQRK